MGILDNAKQVADLVKKYNDQELYAKIIDLRDEIFTLKEENMKLREKVSQLESEAKVNDNIIYEAPFYWLRTSEGKDGPYCQRCHDLENDLIRLQNDGSPGAWRCYSCKNFFKDSDYRPPRPTSIMRG